VSAESKGIGMDLARAWPEDEVQVWCARLEADTETVERAYLQLSRDEQDRASRFRHATLRATFVLSRSILRTLLARLCDCSPTDLEFAYGEQGKPILAAPSSALQFNLSHSGNIAAYAFAANDELGVDIEKHSPRTDLEQIARRFFCATEYKELLCVPDIERASAFFECWVRKEAYIKAQGRGLSVPLDSFRVSLRPGQPAALLALDDDIESARAWSITAFSPADGYSGAVALRHPLCTFRIHGVCPTAELLANPI
jgi:4'-phosphopantetheinyl transferase